jgi:2-dehydro-3-deoxyphosphogluconate aldolase/(4S)-4-hydroxy-2-oxoglutarate aldolase
MNSVTEQIAKLKILPVVTVRDPSDAAPLAEALTAGGIPAVEITFRAAGAEEALRAVCRAFPEMLAGAGTVLTPAQAESAVAAGAKFIVSPGFDAETVRFCRKAGVPVFPGCVTATEVQQALREGLDVLKFFPAEAAGGLKTIKALSAPFPGVRWMPTGGISPRNLTEYLSFPKILACGGSFLAPESDMKAKDWGRITETCRTTVGLIRSMEKPA